MLAPDSMKRMPKKLAKAENPRQKSDDGDLPPMPLFYAHISADMIVCNTPAPHHHLHLAFYQYMGGIFYDWRILYKIRAYRRRWENIVDMMH